MCPQLKPEPLNLKTYVGFCQPRQTLPTSASLCQLPPHSPHKKRPKRAVIGAKTMQHAPA